MECVGAPSPNFDERPQGHADRHSHAALHRHGDAERRRSRGCAIPRRGSARITRSTKTARSSPCARRMPRLACGRVLLGGRARHQRALHRDRDRQSRATSSAIALFPDAQIEAVIELGAGDRRPPCDSARARARPFRRRAGAQDGSGRAVSVGRAGLGRRRAVAADAQARLKPCRSRMACARSVMAYAPIWMCRQSTVIEAFQRHFRPASSTASRTTEMRAHLAALLAGLTCAPDAADIAARVRWPDGRSLAEGGEESPGSTETRCRITSGGGNSRDSATEITPPAQPRAAAGKGETVR